MKTRRIAGQDVIDAADDDVALDDGEPLMILEADAAAFARHAGHVVRPLRLDRRVEHDVANATRSQNDNRNAW